jgi:hypothetical protein
VTKGWQKRSRPHLPLDSRRLLYQVPPFPLESLTCSRLWQRLWLHYLHVPKPNNFPTRNVFCQYMSLRGESWNQNRRWSRLGFERNMTQFDMIILMKLGYLFWFGFFQVFIRAFQTCLSLYSQCRKTNKFEYMGTLNGGFWTQNMAKLDLEHPAGSKDVEHLRNQFWFGHLPAVD